MNKKSLKLNLPENEFESLDLISKVTGYSRTTIIRQALKAYRKSKAISRLIDNNKEETK